MTCSTRSTDPTPDTQILLILWFQDIYRQEGIKKKLVQESCIHIWDEPYLFRVCSDGLLRRCVPAKGIKIIERCLSSPYRGHYGAFRTHVKIWQCGFFWPTMYEDTRDFI
jgi:hypothetical protein